MLRRNRERRRPARRLEGKTPTLGILATVEEAYTQCSKALIRSGLWNAERHVDPGTMPSGASGSLASLEECDIQAIMESLFDANVKLDRIYEYLLGDDEEEEEDPADPARAEGAVRAEPAKAR